MKQPAELTIKIERKAKKPNAKIKHMDDGGLEVKIGRRKITLPKTVADHMRRLQRRDAMVTFYRHSEYLCSGDGIMHDEWEKHKGDPRFCKAFIDPETFGLILQGMGAREADNFLSVSGVNMLPNSVPFRQWKGTYYPALGVFRHRAPAGEMLREKPSHHG